MSGGQGVDNVRYGVLLVPPWWFLVPVMMQFFLLFLVPVIMQRQVLAVLGQITVKVPQIQFDNVRGFFPL